MGKIFALIDCNNFYVSCERVFNPSLQNKPVVILSSNDGCVISRSNEAKAIGIKMGEPYFKALPIIKEFEVKALSSNFTLYGDISRRIMTILEDYSPRCEVYSIDECFLDFSNLSDERINELCYNIRSRLKQWLGIPVSIGVGPTKTLAKLASEKAKHLPLGISHIKNDLMRYQILENSKINEVWGIGHKYTKKLNSLGIYSAMELAKASDTIIRKVTNVLGLKTIYELRGISCIDLIEVSEPKKSIMVSRSFGKDIDDLEILKQATSYFLSRAAEKLRKTKQMAKSVSIYIRTNPFAKNQKYYSNSITLTLANPTDATNELLSALDKALPTIYRPGFAYKKAGVLLCDFCAKTSKPFNLFDKSEVKAANSKLSATLDSINMIYGSRTIYYASSGVNQVWMPQRNMKSGAHTSKWNEIITAN